MGYHRAGFDVVGVDVNPQPSYPFEFHQYDALKFLRDYDVTPQAIHASPPCQNWSAMNRGNVGNYQDHPALIVPIRRRLRAAGVPYIIENVPNAPLRSPITLCGEMFGLKVIRHRKFESNIALQAPAHLPHRGYAASSYRKTFYYYTVAGNSDGILGSFIDWQAAMGIDWMARRQELVEAIPPAYTEYLGAQLITALSNDPSVAAV